MCLVLKQYCSSDLSEDMKVSIPFCHHSIRSTTHPQVLDCIVVLIKQEAETPFKVTQEFIRNYKIYDVNRPKKISCPSKTA